MTRHVHDTPRDTVVQRIPCTEAEKRAEPLITGRTAIDWKRYADGSLGLLLGPEVRR
jgi:hypothetical protein